jgi:hypothetical protein
MGIIVHETYTTEHGIDVSNYYIRINKIEITKQVLDTTKYNVWIEYDSYPTKEVRLDLKEPFLVASMHLETDTIDDIQGQIYSQLKILHVNCTDD